MKPRRFYYHYNKPASLQRKEPLMSVHFKGVCHIIKKVYCQVKCESKINTRQPRVVMQGFASQVLINKDEAIIL